MYSQHLTLQVLIDLLHGLCMTSSCLCFWAVISGIVLRLIGGLMLQVIGPPLVITVIGKERGDSHSLRCLVVSCELCKGHALCQVILKVVNI